MELRPGATFGSYRIERLLGRGGMGEVWLATQSGLGRHVALKVLPGELAESPRFRDRFIAESRLAASLDHPHIVPIFEAGTADDRLFLAMRFVDGEDLGGIIQRQGRLEPQRAVHLLRGIGQALDAAHDRGLVHRDVKPGNILVARSSGAEHAYLADFGLVKQLGSDASFTRTGQFAGSVESVAPEQIEGRAIDGRADVYSLACVLFTTLTGRLPFPRETDVATLWAHIQAPPPRPSTEDPALASFDDVIGMGMAKDPADRYATAGELMLAADAAVAQTPATTGPGVGASPTSRKSRRIRPSRRAGPILAFAAAGATLALVLALGLGSRGEGGATSSSARASAGGSGGPVGSGPATASSFGRIAFARRSALFADGEWPCLAGGLASTNIWIARDDGTAQAALTADPMGINEAPALSPDGTLVAYLGATDQRGRSTVLIVEAAGGTPRPMIVEPTLAPAAPLRWSPNGKKIAFLAGRTDAGSFLSSIVVVDVATGIGGEVWRPSAPAARVAPTRSPADVALADTSAPPGESEAPLGDDVVAIDWLTDDRFAAVVRHGRVSADEFGETSFSVRAVGRDGQEDGVLLERLDITDRIGGVDVSPDGTTLLVAATAAAGAGGVDIHAVRLDGSSVTQLTNDPGVDAEPVWSPDGRSIAFVSQRGGGADVFVMDAAGANVRQLTTGVDGRVNCSPSWAAGTAPIAAASPSPRGDRDDPRRLEIGRLPPGTYRAAPFDPDFEFTLPNEGWELWNIVPDALSLVRTDEHDVRIQANRVQVVFDGGCIDSPTKTIGPGVIDFVDWLKGHEALAVRGVYPIGTGGVTGLRVDTTLTKVPGGRCPIINDEWAMYPMSVDQFAIAKGEAATFYVLDVHGSRIVVVATAPRATFGDVAPLLDSVLQSILIP
jgi:serine/threonine-protein kinase